MEKLFHFNCDKEVFITFLSGFTVILISMLMVLFPNNEFASIFLRDVLMILIIGFIFPLYFICIIKNKSISVLGIRKNKLGISLIINILLAISLLTMFIKKENRTICFTRNSFYAITYIYTAGIFEMIFIYGFLRYEFEKAFGIIPSIILTTIFYSFHHAGFQPEFKKLFFVGILYLSVFYITQNIFIIFPFFWGVGAIWDVLINSKAGSSLLNFDSFLIALVLLICMFISTLIISYKIKEKTE